MGSNSIWQNANYDWFDMNYKSSHFSTISYTNIRDCLFFIVNICNMSEYNRNFSRSYLSPLSFYSSTSECRLVLSMGRRRNRYISDRIFVHVNVMCIFLFPSSVWQIWTHFITQWLLIYLILVCNQIFMIFLIHPRPIPAHLYV